MYNTVNFVNFTLSLKALEILNFKRINYVRIALAYDLLEILLLLSKVSYDNYYRQELHMQQESGGKCDLLNIPCPYLYLSQRTKRRSLSKCSEYSYNTILLICEENIKEKLNTSKML